VLLGKVAEYNGGLSYPPTGKKFEGTARSLELQTSQKFWEPSKVVATTLSCSTDDGGWIRCGGACPTLATAEAVQPLDCAAVAKYDWTSLPAGTDSTVEWGGNYDDERLEIALKFLAAQGKIEKNLATVALARNIDVQNRSLTIIKMSSKDWVLLHEQVPLVASDDEIRVGQGPGGVFVISHASKHRRCRRRPGSA
jgi:hypothetical protein